MPLKRAVTEFGKTYKDRFALRTYPGTSVPIFIFILGWSRTKPRVTLSAQTMLCCQNSPTQLPEVRRKPPTKSYGPSATAPQPRGLDALLSERTDRTSLVSQWSLSTQTTLLDCFFAHYAFAQPIYNTTISQYPRTHTWARPTAPSSAG